MELRLIPNNTPIKTSVPFLPKRPLVSIQLNGRVFYTVKDTARLFGVREATIRLLSEGNPEFILFVSPLVLASLKRHALLSPHAVHLQVLTETGLRHLATRIYTKEARAVRRYLFSNNQNTERKVSSGK